MLTVCYFASVRDKLGLSEEKLEFHPSITNVAELRHHLAARGGVWQLLLQGTTLCARNQDLCRTDAPVYDGDEIAFFPPVTGG